MHESSNRLANLFLALGAKPGDRIGILLPQAPETAYAHIAAYNIGCIAIPLFTLFGAEALRYRFGNSGALVVVINAAGAAELAAMRNQLPAWTPILKGYGAHIATL